MSKKDYQAIARMLHGADPAGTAVTDPADTWRSIVEGMANVLADDSPRFDRQRFIEACETGTTKGMRK